MLKPDAIVIHPSSIDYPIWRTQIRKDRDYFNKYIVVFSETNMGINVRDFVKSELKDLSITFLEVGTGAGDWANIAAHTAINQVVASHFIILHQDLLFWNSNILPTVFSTNEKLVSFQENGLEDRFCPAFFLIERDLFRRTSQDFSVQQVNYKGQTKQVDHLGALSIELQKLHPQYKLLEDFGFNQPRDYEHIRGFAYCYNVMMLNQPLLGPQFRRFVEINRSILSGGLGKINHYTPFLSYIQKAAALPIG